MFIPSTQVSENAEEWTCCVNGSDRAAFGSWTYRVPDLVISTSREPNPARKPMRLNLEMVPCELVSTALICSAPGWKKNPDGMTLSPQECWSIILDSMINVPASSCLAVNLFP